MSDFKFELNYAGVGELLKSQAMMDVCKEYAERMAENLGDGYKVEGYVAGTRVVAHSVKAQKENLENNTLLKEMGNNHD